MLLFIFLTLRWNFLGAQAVVSCLCHHLTPPPRAQGLGRLWHCTMMYSARRNAESLVFLFFLFDGVVRNRLYEMNNEDDETQLKNTLSLLIDIGIVSYNL